MTGHSESICRKCVHSYVCERFNQNRDSDNQKCHFLNDHFVPTIEAEPVRHGRWVERPNTKGQVYCSECGTLEKTTDNNFKSMHCPHCGAKMDGDDDATN